MMMGEFACWARCGYVRMFESNLDSIKKFSGTPRAVMKRTVNWTELETVVR